MFAKTTIIASLLAVASAINSKVYICTNANFKGNCLHISPEQLTCNNIPAPFNERLGSILAPHDRECWVFPETKPKCNGIKDFTEIGLCDPADGEEWCKHDIVIVKAGQAKNDLRGKKYGTIRC